MANVLLRFQLALLEQAEAKAKVVLLAAQQAKGIASDIKAGLVQGARDKLIAARSAKESALEALRSKKKTVRDSLNLDDGQTDEISRALRKGRKGFMDFAGNPLRSALSGDVSGGLLGLAGELGGPFVKLITGFVVAKVLEVVDEKIAQEVELRVNALQARLEEQRYQDDYQRRLKDEPDFRRAEAIRTADEIYQDEDRLRAQGFGRSYDFADGM